MNTQSDSQPSGDMDISVIIVNWNTKKLLKDCLHSLHKTVSGIIYEVIVVDNGSSDGSLEMLKAEFPGVITIVNNENRGFGAANNQGFAVMKGKYALLLNTDTVLTAGAVSKLWDFCESNETAGIVCGQLLNANGSKQNSVASFPSLITLATNTSLLEYVFPRIYPSKRYEHKQPIAVDSAIGACMMIRKKALEETGFFDERYFFFFEETDLARAMRVRGWKVYHVPDAFIYHLQGQSVGHEADSRKAFYRSRYQFLKKWHNPCYYFAAKGIILVRLSADCLLNLAGVFLTLGLTDTFRRKFVTYAELIIWHFKSFVARDRDNDQIIH